MWTFVVSESSPCCRFSGLFRFVISEVMGVPEDMDYYRPGVVEVPACNCTIGDDRAVSLQTASAQPLIDAIRMYLGAPAERDAIAAAGLRLFRDRPMSEGLRPVLEALEASQ